MHPLSENWKQKEKKRKEKSNCKRISNMACMCRGGKN